MRVVTTNGNKGYEVYGHRFVDSWQNWPESAELWWYVEDYEVPDLPRTTVVPLTKLQGLQNLKSNYAHYKPVSWQWDVVRFANKVYAAYDALKGYKGIGVWLDNDCVTFNKVPDGYIESLLDGAYLGIFRRVGLHTETGFWVMDCSHEQHEAFLEAWIDWYDSSRFKELPEWHDCWTLDMTVRQFEKAGLIKVQNLTVKGDKSMHPLSNAELGKYIDHCKGQRKLTGFSPENKNRSENEVVIQ
jgi:hypothetical protein